MSDSPHPNGPETNDTQPETWSAPARLISGMAHDARTPLGSVLMMAELLAADPKGNLDPKQLGYAEKIRQAAVEVRDLLETVNLMAKLAARRIESSPAPTALRSLVERKVEAMMEGREGPSPAVRFEDAVPERVEVDAERLGMCLNQLLEAAETASPGQVAMRCGVSDGLLICEVTDRGESPDPDDLATLFEPFAAGKRRWRSGGGKNLGLPLAQALARWAGGGLEAVDSEAEGLTLRLRWPLGNASA